MKFLWLLLVAAAIQGCAFSSEFVVSYEHDDVTAAYVARAR